MFKTDIITKLKTGAMAIVRTETIGRGIENAQGCLNGGVDIFGNQLYIYLMPVK